MIFKILLYVMILYVIILNVMILYVDNIYYIRLILAAVILTFGWYQGFSQPSNATLCNDILFI